MYRRTRKEMKRDSWQCYEGMSTHCKKSAKEQFKRPTAYETMRQAKEVLWHFVWEMFSSTFGDMKQRTGKKMLIKPVHI